MPKTTARKRAGPISLVQIWCLKDHDARPCALCDKPGESVQGFEFSQGGNRVCPACALAVGFTIEAQLLTRILQAYARR